MKSRRYKRKTTLLDRVIYCAMGMISGGLLSLLIIVPVCAYMLEEGSFYLFIWLIPPVFGLVMGIWGFAATDKMVDTLSRWWSNVIGL